MILQLSFRSVLCCALLIVGAGWSVTGNAADAALVADAHTPDVKPELAANEPAKSAEGKATDEKPSVAAPADASKDNGGPEVHLVALRTDVAKRYSKIVPPLPVPPFSTWKRWVKEHEIA